MDGNLCKYRLRYSLTKEKEQNEEIEFQCIRLVINILSPEF